jgi:hypothetical protein
MAFLLKWLVQTHFTRETFDFQLNSNETHPYQFQKHDLSVKINGLTQRAADKWESARFLAVFNASAGLRFQALSASRPLAANANRSAAKETVMEIRETLPKRRVILLLLVLFILLALSVVLTQPFVIHRLSSKVFTSYEIYLLKYPNSHLVKKEIKPTSKVTMATDNTYYTSDDIDIVLEYMEHQQPGFIQLQGSYVIVEPTFRNTTCASETIFSSIFQILEKGIPCIEVSIYPSETSGTSILISENWSSMGFPAWLRRW